MEEQPLDTMAAIQEYILDEFGADRDAIAPDDNLLAQGVIDSMGIVKLVEFLEGRFKVRIGEEEMIPENFESIRCISNFVEQKQVG
jgi:acyl carrier protein